MRYKLFKPVNMDLNLILTQELWVLHRKVKILKWGFCHQNSIEERGLIHFRCKPENMNFYWLTLKWSSRCFTLIVALCNFTFKSTFILFIYCKSTLCCSNRKRCICTVISKNELTLNKIFIFHHTHSQALVWPYVVCDVYVYYSTNNYVLYMRI